MSVEGTAPVTLTEGQAAPAPADGATGTAPAVDIGQGASPADTGQGQAAPAPATPDEPTFFDPTSLPPELMPGYKQMQSAFTKKMQAISGEKQKIEAYNAFMADPVGQMQQVARQYGYALTRAEAAAAIQGQQAQGQQEWAPQTWDDVIARTKAETREEILRELQPLIGNVQKVTASNIERQLAEIDPQWANYQDEMRSNLSQYPNLVNDIGKLYKLSVPDEVLHSRAVQQALSKFQSKTDQAKVGGSSKASRTEPAMPDLTKMKSGDAFNAAVEIARKRLASGG
jgi:hypothetical protein